MRHHLPRFVSVRQTIQLLALLVVVIYPIYARSQAISNANSLKISWFDIRQFGVEGRGWEDTKDFYDRLPAKAEGKVRPPVWDLSHDSYFTCACGS